jgi:DUF1009 family protein
MGGGLSFLLPLSEPTALLLTFPVTVLNVPDEPEPCNTLCTSAAFKFFLFYIADITIIVAGMLSEKLPTEIYIIAGRGAYPRLLAESARIQGVTHIVVIAFKKETDPRIEKIVDKVHWINLGQLGRMLDTMAATGIKHAVMAGQITPTHLFRVRMDAKLIALLKKLPERNADTIFGAIGDELKAIGIELLPASSFMQAHMPTTGLLSKRPPTETEMNDIQMGFHVAKATSGLDIGQTVVIKEGTILAVEAFEGTDATILRAGRLGGAGAVLIKVAKPGHDMRFDIPVIGLHTIKSLRKAKIAAVAIESGKAILLEREKIIDRMDALNIAFTVIDSKNKEQ